MSKLMQTMGPFAADTGVLSAALQSGGGFGSGHLLCNPYVGVIENGCTFREWMDKEWLVRAWSEIVDRADKERRKTELKYTINRLRLIRLIMTCHRTRTWMLIRWRIMVR